MIRVLLLLAIALAAAHGAALPTTVDLRVDRKPLFVLLQRIARQCDAGLVVDHRLAPVVDREVTLAISEAPWADAMKLLADDYRIALTLSAGRLVVADVDEAARRTMTTRTYGLATLTRRIDDFPGQSLAIPEPGGSGSRLMPPISAQPVAEINSAIELIRKNVAPESWDQRGVGMSADATHLQVTQQPDVQVRVGAYLAQLERVAARQVAVRCYRLPAGTEVAAPVLDAASWQRLAPAAGLPIGVFVALDEQRNHYFSGVQRSYVGDADVNQEVFAPIVSSFTTGVVVEARPQVVKQGVLLGVRLFASTDEKTATTVIADGHGVPAVTLDLPASTLVSSQDTRLVPVGGAALYGSGDRIYAVTVEVLDYAQSP